MKPEHRGRAMDLPEIRSAYAALPPFPDFPGEREWPDRLRTLEDFLECGRLVVGDIGHVRGFDDRLDRAELERRRAMFPELWTLLFRAFPPDPLA